MSNLQSETASNVIRRISSGINKWHAIFHVDNVLILNKRKTSDKQSLSKTKAVYKLLLDLWIVFVFVFVCRSSVTRLNGLILIMRRTMLESMCFFFVAYFVIWIVMGYANVMNHQRNLTIYEFHLM